MLFHLVCTDRRYQRLNCFNIREMQSMLKQKFFEDLITTEDHRELMSLTTINSRFKDNTVSSVNPDILNFFDKGTSLVFKNRNYMYVTYTDQVLNTPYPHFHIIFNSGISGLRDYFIVVINELLTTFNDNLFYSTQDFYLLHNFQLTSLYNNIISFFMLSSNFSYNNQNTIFGGNIVLNDSNRDQPNAYFFETNGVAVSQNFNKYTDLENLNSIRFARFNNPSIQYSFKSGSYIEKFKWDKLYPSILTSFIEVSKIKNQVKPSWFFSTEFDEFFKIYLNILDVRFINRDEVLRGISQEFKLARDHVNSSHIWGSYATPVAALTDTQFVNLR